jgi:hypothetical protein
LLSKPEEIATNIQADLDETIANEQQNTWSATGTTTTPNTPPRSNTAESLPSPFPLTILLPPRVQQEKITELLQRIDPEKKFQPTIVQPSSLATYLRSLDAFTTGSRQADIILAPWQEISRLHHRSAQIDRSSTSAPTGQFHPQIGGLLTATKSMFIPHAIDPRVTVTMAPTRNLTLGTFLQTHRSPLEFLVEQAPTDPLHLTLTQLWLDQLFSAANISLIPKVFLTTETAPCLPNTACLSTETNKQAIRAPISELTPNDLKSFSVSLFPSLDSTIPTTIRGWTVRGNDTTPYVTQRLNRIQKYIAVMSADQLPYESPLLPAYFPRLSRLILQDELAWLQPSIYKLSLLHNSTKQLQTWFTLLPISGLLDKSYRPELYLEKRQEIRTK